MLIGFLASLGTEVVEAKPSVKTEITKYGIVIASIFPSNKINYDVDVLSAESGTKKIKSAIDLIFHKSPFNSSLIKHLSEFGKILIIYDPAFPKTQIANIFWLMPF